MPDVDPTQSAVLRIHFGHYWRAWAWLRQQFTVTSLSALAGVVVFCGGYIVHLRQDVAVVRERVVVLETRVVPVITSGNRVAAIEQAVEDHDRRLTRLEDNYDTAQREAARPPRRERGR